MKTTDINKTNINPLSDAVPCSTRGPLHRAMQNRSFEGAILFIGSIRQEKFQRFVVLKQYIDSRKVSSVYNFSNHLLNELAEKTSHHRLKYKAHVGLNVKDTCKLGAPQMIMSTKYIGYAKDQKVSA